MKNIYHDSSFQLMSREDIETWCSINKTLLVGSAIFTRNNSITSKLVRWAETWKNKDKIFNPSHVGSIVRKNNKLFVVDVIPPRTKITPLVDYLMRKDIEFVLVKRDFKLNGKMFSLNMVDRVGDFYPFLSAIRSVFSKRQSKYSQHCSEAHIRQLQLQGLYKDINPEITPLELLNLLTDK